MYDNRGAPTPTPCKKRRSSVEDEFWQDRIAGYYYAYFAAYRSIVGLVCLGFREETEGEEAAESGGARGGAR